MLKIVRGLGPVYGNAEPVVIDNRVFIPTEDEDTGEVISPEEQRRKEDEERAERERRIQEEVDARVAKVLNDRSEALERERTRIIEDAKNEAASITADAKVATMAVIDKANKECVKIKEIARHEGHTQGFAEGKEESLDKYKKYIDAAGTLLSEINARKEAYYISNEEDLRATVFEVAQKVVHAELKASPEVIENILADAAKNFRNSDYIKIILREEEMTERFKTDEKLINKIIPFIPEIEIVFDEDTEEGTIVLDNGSEIVDASIPTQLDFLKEILNNTRGVSNDDESFELDNIVGETPAETLGGGAEISEEFSSEFSDEFPAEIAEEEALTGFAEAADDSGDVAESLLNGGMEISEDIPMEEPADDFVSAVSEAVDDIEEVGETKKGTKKRAKKSEE